MAEWKKIVEDHFHRTEAMAVPGGMIVRTALGSYPGETVAMVFVPDEGDQLARVWIKENEVKK
jgi:hypothetical protein